MTEQEIIEDILDEFDFSKVQQVMEALDWTWYIEGDMSSPPEIPTLGQLRKKARYLMKCCIGQNNFTTATGGFHARKETFDGLPFYQLQFVVTEWHNHN